MGLSIVLALIACRPIGATDEQRAGARTAPEVDARLVVVADFDRDGRLDEASALAQSLDAIDIRLSRGQHPVRMATRGILVGLSAGDSTRTATSTSWG
jgi:hypothetical protein